MILQAVISLSRELIIAHGHALEDEEHVRDLGAKHKERIIEEDRPASRERADRLVLLKLRANTRSRSRMHAVFGRARVSEGLRLRQGI